MDFKALILQGLKEQDNAAINRKNVLSVVNSFKAQLSEATNEVVDLEYTGSWSDMVQAITGQPAEFETIVVTAINRKTKSSRKQLFQIKIPPEAFPVSLIYRAQEVICSDLEAFEKGMSDLAADSFIARLIYTVMNSK